MGQGYRWPYDASWQLVCPSLRVVCTPTPPSLAFAFGSSLLAFLKPFPSKGLGCCHRLPPVLSFGKRQVLSPLALPSLPFGKGQMVINAPRLLASWTVSWTYQFCLFQTNRANYNNAFIVSLKKRESESRGVRGAPAEEKV